MNIPAGISAPLLRLRTHGASLLPEKVRKVFRLSRTVSVTREGKWYILVVLVTGAVAINTGNNLLYLVLATLLSLIIISGLMSEFTMKYIDIRREQPRHAFKGMPFTSTLHIRNRKKIIPSISFRVYELPCRGMESKYSYVVKVGAGKDYTAAATRTCTSRGRLVLKGFKLSTTFPFGLFLKSKTLREPEQIIVYPSIKPMRDVRLLKGTLPARGESRCARGSGSELYNIRSYTESDDARHIHWKSAARAETLMVKEFEQEAKKSVIVSFQNLTEEGAGEVFEDSVDEAAGTVDFFLEKGYTVALETLSGTIAEGAGKAHLYRLLEYLALLEPAGRGKPAIKVSLV
ncbi:MAG: DUF58 domain-containing protein [Thermodesulfobacteriota bacterium]